jgi:hypothetical protein
VPERVARLDGHEREALERPDRLLVNRERHFGGGGNVSLLEPELVGTPVIFLPGFFHPPALFFPVLGTCYKFDGVRAPAVIEAFQRHPARKAHAKGRLRVARAQGHPLACPPVAFDMAEVFVAHDSSLIADDLGQL